jgi:hypothetical protein
MLNITEFQADIIKLFAIFYLSLIANYIGTGLFPSKLMHTITTHKPIQLFTAFLLFFFSVTLSTNTDTTSPIEKLIHSFIYFIGFLIVIRLDMILSALIILFIFIIYFIELNKDFYVNSSSHEDDDNKMDNDNKYWITFNTPYKIRLFKVKQTDFKIINKIEISLYYVIFILLVAGFIEYVGKIRDTLSKPNKLTWVDIMLDTNISKLQYNKSFWNYFKIGLGLK